MRLKFDQAYLDDSCYAYDNDFPSITTSSSWGNAMMQMPLAHYYRAHEQPLL